MTVLWKEVDEVCKKSKTCTRCGTKCNSNCKSVRLTASEKVDWTEKITDVNVETLRGKY